MKFKKYEAIQELSKLHELYPNQSEVSGQMQAVEDLANYLQGIYDKGYQHGQKDAIDSLT